MRTRVATALLLVSLCLAVPAVAEEAEVLGVMARPAAAWPWLGPVNPVCQTNLSDDGTPPLNACCRWAVPPCTPVQSFSVGDTAIMNTYWTETLPAPSGNLTVTFAAAVRGNSGAGPFIVVQPPVAISYGPVPAGTWEFCAYIRRVMPPGAVGISPMLPAFQVMAPTGTVVGQCPPVSVLP